MIPFSSWRRLSVAGWAAGCALVVGLMPAPSVAQQFEGELDVLTIEVPVHVTTRGGQPIRGLEASDFELFESGVRQELTGFETVDLEALPAVDGGEMRELSSAVRRHLLLLFDLSFSSPTAILRARQAAQSLVLDHLHPTDLVAVATYSLEQGPRLIVTFTPDRAQVARALATLGVQRGVLRTADLDPLKFLVETPTLGAGGGDAGTGDERTDVSTGAEGALLEHLRQINLQLERGERRFEQTRITAWSRALADMAGSLQAVRGRKQVVYFSEGFDSTLLLGRQPTSEDPLQQQEDVDVLRGETWLVDTDSRHGSTRLQQDVHRMLTEFRRSDSIIQAIDIGGLRAEVGQAGVESQGRHGLFYLAHETGGRLVRDSNRLDEALADLLAGSSVTYLLSYQPASPGRPGELRNLRVRVRGVRGARISHREGYVVPRPFGELPALERSLLASDLIASAVPRREIAVDILTPAFRAAPDLAYLPVILEIDGRSLLSGHDDAALTVEIYAYITDERGEMRDYFSQLVTLDLRRNREVLETRGLKYYGQLTVAPGRYLARVLVRNGQTGRVGVETARIVVPDWRLDEPVLLTPFILEREASWLMVRDDSMAGDGASVVYPFTVQGEPFVPAAYAELATGEVAELCLMLYNWGDAAPTVLARVLGEDGSEAAGGQFALRQRTVTGISGLDKLLASFDTEGLDTGEYRLEVSVSAADGEGPSLQSIIPFRVVS